MVKKGIIGDPVGDLLIRIQNAARAGRNTCDVPYSRLKETVCVVLQKEGILTSVKVQGEGVHRSLELGIGKRASVLSVRRISKPGRRIYEPSSALHSLKNGHGFMLVSTSKGIMTGLEAHEKGIGGEVIAHIS